MQLNLSPFQIYLLGANAASLVLHTIDYWIFQRTGRELISHSFLSLLTAAGGAAGTLLAFALWDRKTVKDNAWWHVNAAAFFLIWCVVVCFVYVTPFRMDALVSSLQRSHTVLLAYLAGINLVTLVAFGMDKARAADRKWRIPEATLLGLSLLGGSIGGLVGMRAFNHKVRSPQFAYGLPVTLVANAAVVLFLLNAGLA